MQLQKSVLMTIIGIIIVYAAIFVLSDIQKLSSILATMKIELIPIILGIQVGSFFLRSIRQKELFKCVGVNIPLKNNFVLFLSGLSMMFTPGGIGSAIKLQFLKNEYGFQRRKTLPVVFYERYHDFLAIVTVMLGISIVYSFLASQILLTTACIIIFVIFLLLRSEKLLNLFLKKFGKIKFVKKFLDSTDEMSFSLSTLNKKRPFLSGWFLGIGAVMLDLVAVFMTFHALDLQFDFTYTSQVFLTSILAGLFSFLPGGIGVTEGSFLAILSSNGLEISSASAVVLMVRLLTIWYMTIVGLTALRFMKFK